jgi:3'(2'), 5'-bisphosphate nucleotidase
VRLDPRFAEEIDALPPLHALTAVVWQAAAAIAAIDPSRVPSRLKADHTPVSSADVAAERALIEGLGRLAPGLPIVSEEGGTSPGADLGPASFALIDPLDGTREFLAGRPEFTVNLAIVVRGVPVIGIIAAPALHGLWRGVVGRGANYLHGPSGTNVVEIRTRPRPPAGLIAAVSRSHFDPRTAAFLSHFTLADRIVCGSSLKFCALADGRADLYPRLAPICEWDIAAGHAILAAAGGTAVTPEGEALPYGRARAGFRLDGFVACADPSAMPAIREALAGAGPSP